MNPEDFLRDPTTNPEILAHIAQDRQDLWPQVLSHPNCYPELAQWIIEGDPRLANYTAQPATLAQPTTLAQQAMPTGEDFPPPPPQRRKKKGVIVGIAAVLVVLLAGGGYLATSFLRGGSRTPTAAAESLVKSVLEGKLLSAVKSIAPSEVSGLIDGLSNLDAIESKDNDSGSDDDVDLPQTVDDAAKAFDVSVSDLEFEEEPIIDGQVTRVLAVGGQITVSIDRDLLSDAIMPVFDDYASSLCGEFNDDEYVDECEANSGNAARDLINEISANIEAEQPINIATFSRDYGVRDGILSLISVKEKGRWYISPLMSIADQYVYEYVYLDQDSRGPVLGDELIEQEKASSPEEAVSATAQAVADGSITKLAATLSLPERRLLSVYGPFLESEGVGDPWWPSGYSMVLESEEFSAEKEDGVTVVSPEDFSFTILEDQWIDVGVSVNSTCANVTDGDYGDSSRLCLNDRNNGVFGRLGLSYSAVTVKEDGGWVVSPLNTLYYHLTTAANSVIDLYNDDRLGELWTSSY